MNPSVSVLMTAYNRQNYIAESIESVLRSTYANFELIIVDDCSGDKTIEIAEQFRQKDKRIKIFVNSLNLGDYLNRNQAASYATGKYLKYVDSDDKLEPDALGKMVAVMEEHPEAGLGINLELNDGSISSRLLNSREAYRCHYFDQPIFFASPGLVIFKKECFEAVGGFPEKRMVSDFEMWHKMALAFPVVLIPGNLYWLRQHAGQEVAEQDHYIEEYEKIKIRYLFSSKSPLSYQEASQVIHNRKKTLLKIFARKLVSFELRAAAVRARVLLFYIRHFSLLKNKALTS
ncbi:glycosyltransferase family 2 protein [Flavisolibacter sp. BT320]|nr:glycosyltransferase family 2 protein [Flavisolibacter longurius]